MNFRFIPINENIIIAELADAHFIINKAQDVLDIFGDLIARDCYRIIISEKNLHPDFFNLKTGLAGDVLQKFSNYNFKLAIVGDFARYTNKSLQDFILESNKSGVAFFTDTISSALTGLGK